MILSASPASAGDDAYAKTTDSPIGGEATWTHTGDRLEACDVEEDGLRVRVEMTYAGGSFSFQVLNGEGACHEGVKDLPEGTAVTVKVCLKNGSAGREVRCGTGHGIA